MSAEVRTVEALGKEVTYDPDMPMGAIRGLMKAGEDSNIEGMMTALQKIVLSWDFDGDPTAGIEAWDNLRRSEFLAITAAVMEDMGSLGEA